MINLNKNEIEKFGFNPFNLNKLYKKPYKELALLIITLKVIYTCNKGIQTKISSLFFSTKHIFN